LSEQIIRHSIMRLFHKFKFPTAMFSKRVVPYCCRVVTIRAVVTFMNRTDISGTRLESTLTF